MAERGCIWESVVPAFQLRLGLCLGADLGKSPEPAEPRCPSLRQPSKDAVGTKRAALQLAECWWLGVQVLACTDPLLIIGSFISFFWLRPRHMENSGAGNRTHTISVTKPDLQPSEPPGNSNYWTFLLPRFSTRRRE